MNENDLFNFQLEYTFTADWLAELDRQLALLLSTREGTMPLDRAFGLNMDFVDMPPEAAKGLPAEVHRKGVQIHTGGAGAGSDLDRRQHRKTFSQGGDNKCLIFPQFRTPGRVFHRQQDH